MHKRAFLFGGIGTLVETSELQRAAFNHAFRDAGLDWHWRRQDYAQMLDSSGGTVRIARYAEIHGTPLTAEAAENLHRSKSAHFHRLLQDGGLQPRPGVKRILRDCEKNGVLVGLASATDSDTIALLLTAAQLDAERFALICDRSKIEQPKPAPDVYHYCLARLGVAPADAIAVEDSTSGLRAALSAGVRCIATPGDNTLHQDYEGAVAVLTCLGDEHTAAQSLEPSGVQPADQRGITVSDCFAAQAA
jgi:HAD superfamily hydrolase (TIGR01509 family)